MSSEIFFVSLAAVLLVVALGFHFRREAEARRAARRALTARAHGVIGSLTAHDLPSGYQKLAGVWRGLPVIIEPIVDTLAVRKLPVLWLSVTMTTPLPVKARFNLMMRPTGSEIFSRFRDLPIAISLPPEFPDTAQARTDNAALLPEPGLITRHLEPFRTGKAKELLITPDGIRIVWLIAEATRGRYLIFRDADFEPATLDHGTWTDMLSVMRAIRDDLLAAAEVRG